MAAIGMGVADLIYEWVDKRGKKLNEIIDLRKDLVYRNDGTFKEQYMIKEKRYDFTL